MTQGVVVGRGDGVGMALDTGGGGMGRLPQVVELCGWGGMVGCGLVWLV